MWKVTKYLFYKSYKFYKYEMGDRIPHFTASLVIIGLFVFWISILLNFIDPFDIKKEDWLIFVLLVISTWSYIFFHNGRWKEIIKEFENESEQQRKRGRILSVLFTIFTIVMFIISLFVLDSN